MLRELAGPLRLLAPTLVAGLALLSPTPSQAFCGFYVSGADAELFNNATMVVLMRAGTRTVLSMRNDYQGSSTGSKDPCEVGIGIGNTGMIGRGAGGSGSGYGRGAGAGSSSVVVEAEFAVGEYEIVILSATESNGLDAWLRGNHYNIPPGAEPLLRPYVEQGMKFFVAKVDPKKVQFDANGHAQPGVVQEQPNVSGALDADIIRRIGRAHTNEIRTCHGRGLSKDPKLQGKVSVDFVIDEAGAVKQAKVGSSTLSDASVGACMAAAVRRWNFPRPRDKRKLDVSMTYQLSGQAGVASSTPSQGPQTRPLRCSPTRAKHRRKPRPRRAARARATSSPRRCSPALPCACSRGSAVAVDRRVAMPSAQDFARPGADMAPPSSTWPSRTCAVPTKRSGPPPATHVAASEVAIARWARMIRRVP